MSPSNTAAHDRAAILVEALPYIRKFRGATVVVKYGGNAMTDPSLARQFAEDVVLLHSVGLHPVVVHGGGPQIGELMAKLGKEPEFRDGLRVTDAETLDIARMVLVGRVNRDLVGAINVHGPLAVGVSGEDARLLLASPRSPELGFVGDVEDVDPTIVERLLAEDLVPVVATIGSDEASQPYNINADTAAAALAEALRAEKLVYLTDVEANAIGTMRADRIYQRWMQDPRLSWPDAFAFGPAGELYIVANQLQRTPFLNGGVDEVKRPFPIFKIADVAPRPFARQ